MARASGTGKPLLELKSRTTFRLSLRTELCFAMAAFADPATLREHWQDVARRVRAAQDPPSRNLSGIGALWVAMPDVWQAADLDSPFDEIMRQFDSLPTSEFQRRLFEGIFHDEQVVEALLRSRVATGFGIGKASPEKREWLAHLGLYPYEGSTSIGQAIEMLRSSPRRFRRIVGAAIRAVWRNGFETAWSGMQTGYATSLAFHAQLFQATGLGDFFRLAHVRVEANERSSCLRALRGGYETSASRVSRLYIAPSAFNRNQYWFAYHGPKKSEIFVCPYYDARIADVFVDARPAGLTVTDPALILRALGDSTRYAIISLIAHNPRTSADLAKALGLSRPTVSHHMGLLREAGLIDESLVDGSITLMPRRATLESLSASLVSQIYSASAPAGARLTRRPRR